MPCPHDLEDDECSICRRRARLAAGTLRVERNPAPVTEFRAHYPGICRGCALDIYPGQMIHRVDSDAFAHKGC